jgi:chromosome segregation ATPase
MTDFKKDEDEYESQAFRRLETEFQAVLAEIGGDRQLERFRVEYEKMYRALKVSYENEKKLIKACKDRNNSIAESTIKVQQALRLSQEESDNMRVFKSELDRALKMLETYKEKDDKSRQTIGKLRDQIGQLGRIVEQGSGLAVGHDSTVNELLRAKEELAREVTLLLEQIGGSRREQAELEERLNRLQSLRTQAEIDIRSLKTQITESKQKLEEEDENKRKTETELDLEKTEFERQQIESKERADEFRRLNSTREARSKEWMSLRDERKETSAGLEEAKKQLKLFEEKKGDLEQKSQDISKNLNLVEDEIRQTEDEITTLEKTVKDLALTQGNLTSLQAKLSTEKTEAEQQRDEARNYVKELIDESETMRKLTEGDGKTLEGLKRERDIMMKNIIKEREMVKVQAEQLIALANNKKKLKNEIDGYSNETQKMVQKTYSLQKEAERYGVEKSRATAKYSQCLEEVKLCNSIIAELQKKNVEAEQKLKQQQSLYENVRADRNLYSKNLLDSAAEIVELEKKKKIMVHRIHQLKEEIVAKENELIKEHRNKNEIELAKTQLDAAVKIKEQEEGRLEEEIKKFENDIQRLKYIIGEVENEKLKQKKELDLVVNERDILGTQLIRRNVELELLYEKIKIYASTLEKGEQQYEERLADIEVLKGRIGELKVAVRTCKNESKTVAELSLELHQLEMETLEEKIKRKALSEELENPMNVHRWRKLEGTDPETYELITKIHTLLRRLISKTEDVVYKQTEMQGLEVKYEALKKSLSRQPGPESGEQLSLYKQTLDEKREQMDSMEQQLALYQAQVMEYKYQIDRLNRELQETKRSYFTIKKREYLVREQQAKAEGRDKPQIVRQPPQQRFTGGGFNLAI